MFFMLQVSVLEFILCIYFKVRKVGEIVYFLLRFYKSIIFIFKETLKNCIIFNYEDECAFASEYLSLQDAGHPVHRTNSNSPELLSDLNLPLLLFI